MLPRPRDSRLARPLDVGGAPRRQEGSLRRRRRQRRQPRRGARHPLRFSSFATCRRRLYATPPYTRHTAISQCRQVKIVSLYQRTEIFVPHDAAPPSTSPAGHDEIMLFMHKTFLDMFASFSFPSRLPFQNGASPTYFACRSRMTLRYQPLMRAAF